MKKYLKQSFILLALLGVLFTSCKKDYPEPPIQDLPVGTVYTIDSILTMESGTVFNEDASVYGIITADEHSGNLYKAAFLQDRATGKAIELYMNATSGVRIGDSIRVYLKDVTYTMYNGLPQLSNFEADGHIIILANNKPIEPAKATIAEVVEGKYLAGLVKLDNVMFTERNTFAEPTTYGNRTLVDPTDFSKSVIVRTSNYANFANDSLPQGTGSLVCIASVYGSTWQLLIRSASELKFEGYTPSGGTILPYYQDFASSFGTYTTYDVMGSEKWEIDYSTAKMTGFVGGVNKANEDWLISAPVSLEGVTEVNLTMRYIARYFSNLSQDVTIQVSTDYTTGNPNDFNWTEVDANLSEGSNWTDFNTAEVNLSQFVGQKVVVAVKYVSTEVKAGTIEIQSMLIQEGGGVTPPTPQPGGELQSIPYTQSFASEFGTYAVFDSKGTQSWEIDYSTAKMTGYVGGSYYANEDWLISSPVDLSGVSEAKMTMVYIGRYFNNINEEVTVWASTDYAWSKVNDPESANWVQVPATLTEGSNWNDFLTAEITLADATGQPLTGQTVTFAVKYTSTDQKAGTMEIQSITIEEGSGVTPTPPPTPGQGEGSGTADDPYNVAAGIENVCWECNSQTYTDAPLAWVHGYIVGVVKDGNTSVSSNDQVNWEAPFDLKTNVVIADDPNCREIALCIIVNLPNNKPLRTEVNLVDHPENLGKTLTVYGRLRSYFGQAGLRDSNGTENDFVLEGSTPPPPPTNQYLNETLLTQDSFDNFTPYSVTGDQVWTFDDRYGAKVSGYENNTSYANKDWFISPAVDLTSSTAPVLVFDHARGPESSMNIGVAEGYYTVWVTINYEPGMDPELCDWVQLEGVIHPTVKWTYVSSGELLIPENMRTENTRFGFLYQSADGASATWEIKNVILKEQ